MLDPAAFKFFNKCTAHVEIMNEEGQLERVVFPFPEFCHFLTAESKRNLVEGVDRDTPGRQLFDFIERSEELHAEMKYLHWLEQSMLWRRLRPCPPSLPSKRCLLLTSQVHAMAQVPSMQVSCHQL